MANGTNGNGRTKWLLGVVGTILAGAFLLSWGWSLSAQVELGREFDKLVTDIKVVQGNRFTSKDGLVLTRAVAENTVEIKTLALQLAKLPPPELIKRIDRMEERLDRRIDKLEALMHEKASLLDRSVAKGVTDGP